MERQEAASRSGSPSPAPQLFSAAAEAGQHAPSTSMPVAEQGGPGRDATADALSSREQWGDGGQQAAGGSSTAALEGAEGASVAAGLALGQREEPAEGVQSRQREEEGAQEALQLRLQQGDEGLQGERAWQAEREAALKGKLLRELWGLCKEYGLPRHGRKEMVVQRLVQHEQACRAPSML